MSRAMWKGDLAIGAVRVPVQILGASELPGKAEFNQAHRCSRTKFTRLQTKRWCSTCERDIAHADILRVFEHAPGQFLEITDEQLATCDVEASTDMHLVGLVDELNALYIETTSCLLPVGDAAIEPLETMKAAIGASYAIAELVIRKRRVIVALQGANHGCAVFHLRTEQQVIAMADVPYLRPGVSHVVVRQAKQLLERLDGRFRYADLRDEHSARVRKLLDAQLARVGKATLNTQLKASAKSARRRKSA